MATIIFGKEHYPTCNEDKKGFQEDALNRLHSQYASVQSRIEKAYDDKLDGKITDDLWNSRYRAWQQELETIRSDMARYERANDNYVKKGVEILELAKRARSLYLREDGRGRRRMLNALL